MKPTYDVSQYYHKQGLFVDIATNPFFEKITLAVIAFNAIWIGVDANFNTANTASETPWGWLIMDNMFCLWFLLELVVRLYAFRKKRYCWRDKWFVFDLFLVMLNMFETWFMACLLWFMTGIVHVPERTIDSLQVIRSLRLMRVARLTRLFRVVPQLMVLLKGITQAMSSLLFTLLLLGVFTYMFAVMLKVHADEAPLFHDKYEINTVADAFWCLVVYGVLMDAVSEIVLLLRSESIWWAILFMTFVFLSNLTMLNMLIGILCEVLARVTGDEVDISKKQELERQIYELLDCYDLDDNQLLRRTEFHHMMSNPDLKNILGQNDICHEDLLKLEDILFGVEEEALLTEGTDDDDPSIRWEDLIDKIFKLQGGNAAKVTDVVELRGYIRKNIHKATAGLTATQGGLGATVSSNQLSTGFVSNDMCPLNAPAGGGRFEEQVLATLQAIHDEQSNLRAEVVGLRKQVDVLSGGTSLPGSVI